MTLDELYFGWCHKYEVLKKVKKSNANISGMITPEQAIDPAVISFLQKQVDEVVQLEAELDHWYGLMPEQEQHDAMIYKLKWGDAE